MKKSISHINTLCVARFELNVCFGLLDEADVWPVLPVLKHRLSHGGSV